MRHLRASALLAFVFLVVAGQNAYPCSCGDPNTRQKFRWAQAVFVGRVAAIEELPSEERPEESISRRVTFEASRVFKGRKEKRIVIYAMEGIPDMCGDLKLTVGREYLVYAFRESGVLVVGDDCQPTRSLPGAEDEVGKLKNPLFRLYARLNPLWFGP